MSDVTLGKALRTTIGYSNDRIVPHGFSTIANEKSDFNSDIIEVQLAHKIGSRVSQAFVASESCFRIYRDKNIKKCYNIVTIP